MNDRDKLKAFGARLIFHVINRALPNWAQIATEVARDFHAIFLSGRRGEVLGLISAARALDEAEVEALAREMAGAGGPLAERAARGILETLRRGPRSEEAAEVINHTLLGGTGQALQPSPLDPRQRALGSALLTSVIARRPRAAEPPHPGRWPQVPWFQIHGFLGRGAAAEVYAAYRLDAEGRPVQTCALKVGELRDPRRFKREVEALRGVEHPNLMGYHDSGVLAHPAPARFWISMPCMSGITLRDLMDLRLDLHLRLLLAGQLLDGLAALHAAGIAHRDLKPANALLGDDYRLKLTDFGLSKQQGEILATMAQATAHGEMLGTPAYMSPEQVQGAPTGRAADVWAYGVLLYELLVGAPPFLGRSVGAVWVNIATQPIDVERPAIPPALRRVLKRALERDLEARYPDAVEMSEALRPILERLYEEARLEWYQGAWDHVLDGRLIQTFAEEHHGIAPEALTRAFIQAHPGLPELPLEGLSAALEAAFDAQREAEGIKGSITLSKRPLTTTATDKALQAALPEEVRTHQERFGWRRGARQAGGWARRRWWSAVAVILGFWIAGVAWSLRRETPCELQSPEWAGVQLPPRAFEEQPCNPKGALKGSPSAPIEWIHVKGGTLLHERRPKGGWRKTRIPDLRVSRSEITVAQYMDCVRIGWCSPLPVGFGCNWERDGHESHPVNCVSLQQAQCFASWVGARLPRELEWEYAARSGQPDWSAPWGKGKRRATCARAIVNDPAAGGAGCGLDGTSPVCSRSKGNTRQGLCDMVGNVWEWVDAHGDTRERPEGFGVSRGGGWFHDALAKPAEQRSFEPPNNRAFNLGFRVVKPAGARPKRRLSDAWRIGTSL